MKKIHVLVEGPTEEAFVDDLMAPYLTGVWLNPIIVKTRSEGARPERGGTVTYTAFCRQLKLLLQDSTADLVTMMLDYQGLGTDFPGREDPVGATPVARVCHVEEELRRNVSHPRFLPYLALHEFEAMLFVDPDIVAAVVQDRRVLAGLHAVRSRYRGNPEDINDSPATSPSARIENLCLQEAGSAEIFRKRAHGPVIAKRIGLERIRAECPHFNDWLRALESFSPT